MQGRRLFTIAALVALVAACSTAGIAVVHLHADEQQDRYERLIALEADANRLDALESEANAERRVPLITQAEVRSLLGDMARDLTDLASRGTTGVDPVLRVFTAYRPQIGEEFALMRARDFKRANAIDDEVDFERVRLGLRQAAAATNRVADRSDRFAWIGTFAVMGLGVIALTALLTQLDRAGRRRVRD